MGKDFPINKCQLLCQWNLKMPWKLAIIVAVIGVQLLPGVMADGQSNNCGQDISQKVIYKPGASAAELPHYPDPTLTLLSILPSEKGATIEIRLDRRGQQRPSQYLSVDGGRTWRETDSPLGYTNLPLWFTPTYLMSHVNPKVLYDCYSQCKDGFKRSMDGGKTWIPVHPVISAKIPISEIKLFETGMHSQNLLYAKILINPSDGFRCAVSKDYGESFELLSDEISTFVESRADPSVWYGLVRSSPWLAMSKDGGKSWALLDGSREIFQPIYRNTTRRYFHSWKQNPDDIEMKPLNPIIQLESDPEHFDWIYALTYRGLYMSRDSGKTFRLSSLALGKLYSIDRIAVNPQDGRFIYAVVDLGQFYRSLDYGCSWQKINLPTAVPNTSK
jgi:hypothetical protein